ncbi:hypothetical protein I5535_19970 [Rhodobacteraceae bacterium F11138]|nr:hypothetical protein [Rhodobacteraceae bacterium F11138]
MNEWPVWWSCNAALGHKANVRCGPFDTYPRSYGQPAGRIVPLELEADRSKSLRGCVMAATTYICPIAHVASLLGEVLDFSKPS